MADFIRYTVLIVTCLDILFLKEYCSAQTLTEQRNANRISDRVFQNTVLSRQPISSVRNVEIVRSNETPRIRVLRITNALNPSQRSTGGQTASRQGTLSRPTQTSGTQQRTVRVVPRRTNRLQQTNVRRTGGRGLGVPRDQSSRRITVMRPTGTRQMRTLRTEVIPRPMNVRRSRTRQVARRINTGNRLLPRPGSQFRTTGRQTQRSLSTQPRQAPVTSRRPRPIGPVPRCPLNQNYLCIAFPRNLDRRRARRCVGFCGQRRCVGLCLCACSTTRVSSGQVRPRRVDNRLRSNQGQGRGAGAVSSRTRQDNSSVGTQSPLAGLNFTMDNSVMARLLAEPDLNALVGPEGINQILRGEPPPLLSRRPQVSSTPNVSNIKTTKNATAAIDMGVPIPAGLTPTPLPVNPLLANMLASGESFGEISNELSTEFLRTSIPSLTEFQRPNENIVASSSNNNNNNLQQSPVTGLDANFLGAILPMPSPVSLSRDTQRSRGQTSVVVDPSLLNTGVIEPVSGLNPPKRNRFRSLRRQARQLENIFDANLPLETISEFLSGNNMGPTALRGTITGTGNTAGALSSDSRFLENVMRASGKQESSDVAVMAAMMQSLGGAVDAVSAANSRNNNPRPRMGRSRDVTGPRIPGRPDNRTTGNLLQNFLTGTVKSTDQGMAPPRAGECFAQGRELWCDPLGIWESTPGITRWCMTNCRSLDSNICDQNRCECKCVDTETFRRNYENLSGNSL